jgi:hypothetical protein
MTYIFPESSDLVKFTAYRGSVESLRSFAYLSLTTFGPIWCKSWIHLVKSQIHNGSPAWDDAATRVDK